jgi:L-threonylcarbamoyladenylate synthase
MFDSMRVVQVGADAPRSALREAADLLRSGRLVAFPTETVYGLGANALDERAVERIYAAKGRPAINPLIVHVLNTDAARALAAQWPPAADALAKAFWPGPLTLVVRKSDRIPAIVTAGQDTVGLRVPAHPVALALLEQAGIPIAAPSANRSTQLSPTAAEHVARGLGDDVDLIVDGGPTTVGIESTVVDVTGEVPRVLRPGMISRNAIVRVVGAAADASRVQHEVLRSPGMLGRHYAPHARVRLFETSQREEAARFARGDVDLGLRVGAVVFSPLSAGVEREHVMPSRADAYARDLYATMHALDEAGCDVLYIELPPNEPEWAAIIDRLERSTK